MTAATLVSVAALMLGVWARDARRPRLLVDGRRIDRAAVARGPVAGRPGVARVIAPALVCAGAALGWHLPQGQLGRVLAVMVPCGMVVVAAVVRRARERRERRRLGAALPGLVDDIAASLRSGVGVALALREAVAAAPSDVRPALTPLVAALDEGDSVSDAIDGLTALGGVAGASTFAAVLAVAAPLGAGAAAALEGAADGMRAREAVAREVAALTSQVRTSGAVLAIVPVLGWTVAVIMSPAARAFSLGSRTGQVVVALGLGLDALGLLAIRALAGTVVR